MRRRRDPSGRELRREAAGAPRQLDGPVLTNSPCDTLNQLVAARFQPLPLALYQLLIDRIHVYTYVNLLQNSTRIPDNRSNTLPAA